MRKKIDKISKFVDSFMKILVLLVVCHGLICITLSYILAFLGAAEVVESLSSTMVTEVIAPVTIYGITKTIENVSKYNDWIDRFKKKDDSIDAIDYIHEKSDRGEIDT